MSVSPMQYVSVLLRSGLSGLCWIVAVVEMRLTVSIPKDIVPTNFVMLMGHTILNGMME